MLDQETIGNLIKTFRLAVSNLRIYPPTSQMVLATLDTLFKSVQAVVEKENTLTLSELSGKLMINGVTPESREIQLAANDILRLFSQRRIQSVMLRSGITKEELSDFITNVLRKKREELTEYPHIGLDQTVYVAMVKGEETVVKITEMVQKSGGEIVGLIKSLRESYDLIDQIPEPAVRAQVQDHLAKELAKQDTTVLRDIFDRELPPKLEQSGLKSSLLSALSQEKIKDIFGEISVWYEEVRKNQSSDFTAIEQLEKLKSFMQTILQAPAAKEIPRQFFEELLQKGLLSQLPEWFASQPSRPTTVYEVERLLEKPAVDLLEKDVRDNIPQFVEKLCQIEYTELLGKFVEKLLENLKNSAAKIRLPAAQSIATIYEILQAHNKENLLRYMELPLIEAAKQENSAEVNFYLLEILRLRARQDVLYGEYELALRILDVMHQCRSAEVTFDEKIRSNAEKSLACLVPEILEVLINDLKLDNEKKRLGSLQILTKLGEQATEPLVRVIKESEDPRNRRLAAQALKNLGETARKRFLNELNLGLTTDEIKHVIEVLQILGDADTVEHLNTLLQYPDTGVKKEVMRFLAKLNSSQARVLLIEQLKDTDNTVISEAVHLLGELKCKESGPALLKLMATAKLPAGLQEEICIVLGNVGGNEAIPVLIAKLKKKPFWFLSRSDETERVRMRAAWALRKFSGQDVEEALEKASHDKTAPVSLAAKESLAALRQQKQ